MTRPHLDTGSDAASCPPYDRVKENQVATPSVQAPANPGHAPGRTPARRQGPRVRLSRSTGSGPTRLAAFDAALVGAGLQGFNLIPLSSVVPLGASVDVVGPAEQLTGTHGDLLYCVYAASYATVPGAEAWAGMAWALRTDDSGAGLFVEHSGTTEHGVAADLQATLSSMMAIRDDQYVESGLLLSSARCADRPVAALVIASFQTAGWAVRDQDGPTP